MSDPGRGRRICHIVGDSKFGGGSKIVTRLAEAGRDAGFDVCVLATDRKFAAHLESRGLKVVRLDCIRRKINPVHDLLGLLVLRDHLRREQYDIVHTHTSKAGFLGRLAARLAGVPRIIHTIHGFAFHERTFAPVKMMYVVLERFAAMWCDHLVAVSRFHRDWSLALGIGNAAKNVAIPNGIAELEGCNTAGRQRIRDEFGVGPQDQLVVSIGRLAAGKGIEDLLAAMALIRDWGTPVPRLLLPGVGPLERALAAEAERLDLLGSVSFPGFRTDIGPLLAAADLIVLPSHREGLSIALLEAMSAERPIVATRIGSNTEATDNGECGRIVPVGNAWELGVAMVDLLASPADAGRLANRARAIWQDRYTEEKMTAGYLKLYCSD